MRSRDIVRHRDNLISARGLTPVSFAILTRWPRSESVRCIGTSIKETAKGSAIESLRAERTADDLLSLIHYFGEVFGAFEAFRVKFVDILRPKRTGARLTTHRNDSQAAN